MSLPQCEPQPSQLFGQWRRAARQIFVRCGADNQADEAWTGQREDVRPCSPISEITKLNGCGKSNLLEALRWVMGENRPTAMRGGGMEDVIFNGAATRGARHFAEVALVLDNAERLAPSGFNDLLF